MNLAQQWWEAVTQGFTDTHTTAVPLPVLLGILACAVVLSIPRATWRWFGLYVTFVHELGHAYAALMTGRFVHGLRIGLDHSGRVVSSGRSAFGAAWSGFWGYPAPAVVGLCLIAAFAAGRSGAAMSVGALILLVSLIFLRNLTGILVAVLSAAVAQLLILFATPAAVNYAVLALGVALSVGGVRDLIKLAGVHTRRRNRLSSSDAFILGRTTGVPAFVWLAGFTVVITGCSIASAWLLWGMLSA
ncbi:M50 family metallopeptidase [Paenarthrobacter aurescens]|uniref:Membrane protein n=1 Tax=Paenarthrobacter aurescens TaxID=43663 RepID=A0A4Y3NDZ0_PAEAU|nr:M50 family metallopeptidase [Paenarthrobacter aurescens]MDO6143482.1 M50 family metallopeptidase [Paenarthrobacter aurescens]MDO6147330.1 M50 family metallopeptidase [Paenarthrobacter aurescens]MDO6158574.1 M50 family metallopeptidase [Paenarthrobacter aurescens]MDO6162557.1 M50 family metallopeptidase [Paenarthrobacter aurescens]GEB19912.1 membrane protein [Paenarthrobacter aurescens]